MKYGILNHNNNSLAFFTNIEEAVVNIGDYVQSYGVENAYQKIGIKENEIVYCEKHALNNYYFYEKVLLVMNNVYSGYGVNGALNSFPTPEWVIPVFIGFNCHDEAVIAENKLYFKKWQPIGCRDEKTKEIVKKFGIEAYLTGCSSILFDKRQCFPKEPKIYFVDVSENLMEMLPEEYLKKSICMSHNLKVVEYLQNANDSMYFYALGKKILEEYRSNASLVITSKLHCAAPCMAMGIPVILAKDNIDFRFGWLDKFIPLYSKEHYNEINWNGTIAEVENAKKLLLNVYNEELHYRMHSEKTIKHLAMQEMDAFYSQRTRSRYNEGIYRMLYKVFSNENVLYEASIWGAGRTGGIIYEIIESNFKNVRIKCFIDKYKKGVYKGIKIIEPSEINIGDKECILLCSLPGRIEAVARMKELRLRENKDYFQLYLESTELGG